MKPLKSLKPLQPRRARPVDEAAKARLAAQPSRVQRTKQARRSRGSGLSFARARRRPKQKQGTATRSSAPVFASGHRPAPRKSAKRKSEYVTASTASMCLTVCRSAGPSVAPLGQRGREGVSIPPPYPLWTPYPPLNDQGMSPWTQMRKVAPGVWLKKLFTARQRYCASLFPGAIRPALRLCMRALRARLTPTSGTGRCRCGPAARCSAYTGCGRRRRTAPSW